LPHERVIRSRLRSPSLSNGNSPLRRNRRSGSRHIPQSRKLPAEKRYSLPVGIFSSGGEALLPAQILAGQRRGRASMSYGSFYPTFRPAAQARNRLGRGVRRRYPAAMSCVSARFNHRPWAPPQAGARSTSRLDWDPARPLPWLPQDLHFPPAAFSALHAL